MKRLAILSLVLIGTIALTSGPMVGAVQASGKQDQSQGKGKRKRKGQG